MVLAEAMGGFRVLVSAPMPEPPGGPNVPPEFEPFLPGLDKPGAEAGPQGEAPVAPEAGGTTVPPERHDYGPDWKRSTGEFEPSSVGADGKVHPLWDTSMFDDPNDDLFEPTASPNFEAPAGPRDSVSEGTPDASAPPREPGDEVWNPINYTLETPAPGSSDSPWNPENYDTGQPFRWVKEHVPATAAVGVLFVVGAVAFSGVFDKAETTYVVPLTSFATVAPTSAPSAASPASATAYDCVGEAVVQFDNWNGDFVGIGGAPWSFTTSGKQYCLVAIATYHWNNSAGEVPGTIGLTGPAGVLGPWKATGSAGQGGAQNVNWTAYPPNGPPVILDGKYTCNDSAPATWSANKTSANFGFCRVWVKTAIPATR